MYCKFLTSYCKEKNIQSLTESYAFPPPRPAPKAASLLRGSLKIHPAVVSNNGLPEAPRCRLHQLLFFA